MHSSRSVESSRVLVDVTPGVSWDDVYPDPYPYPYLVHDLSRARDRDLGRDVGRGRSLDFGPYRLVFYHHLSPFPSPCPHRALALARDHDHDLSPAHADHHHAVQTRRHLSAARQAVWTNLTVRISRTLVIRDFYLGVFVRGPASRNGVVSVPSRVPQRRVMKQTSRLDECMDEMAKPRRQ